MIALPSFFPSSKAPVTKPSKKAKSGVKGRAVKKTNEPADALAKNIPETKSDLETAPGELELKGMAEFAPPPRITDWFSGREQGRVRVRFGTLAKGMLQVTRDGETFVIEPQAIPLQHSLFQSGGDTPLTPALVLFTEDGRLGGYIGPGLTADSDPAALIEQIKQVPQLIGLNGIDLSKLPKPVNKLENGQLHLGLEGINIKLGGAFSGNLNVTLIDERVTFDGQADIHIENLASGTLEMTRSEEGLLTGRVTLAMEFPHNIDGELDIQWDGRAITGEGRASYSGEKLSGEIHITMMERSKALQLEEAASAPEAVDQAAKESGDPAKDVDYVLYGEGNLTFAFNEWLTGTAQVILSPQGFITVIGEITPQKEVDLFEPQVWKTPELGFEIKLRYGIPYLASVFIGGSIGIYAYAAIAGKLMDIAVKGTYSTDPKKQNKFTISGRVNVKAEAGVTLKASIFAGLEVLFTEVKAGGSLSATAKIVAVTDFTPTIGYEEKGEGADKKGVFFIKGDLDAFAQAALVLGGELFVSVDPPFWSEEIWTYPLFNKAYPLGEPVGVSLGFDYIFGSKEPPNIEMKEPEFDQDQFISDLLDEKGGGSGDKKKASGTWKEKNNPGSRKPEGTPTGRVKKGNQKDLDKPEPGAAETPKGGNKKGDASRGRTTDKKKENQTPNEKSGRNMMADRKKQVDKEAGDEKSRTPGEKSSSTSQKEGSKWDRGVAAVKQALKPFKGKSLSEKEITELLAPLKKKHGFKKLFAKQQKRKSSFWTIIGVMDEQKTIAEVPKSPSDSPPGSKNNPLELDWPKRAAGNYPKLYLGPVVSDSEKIPQMVLKELKEKQQRRDETGIAELGSNYKAIKKFSENKGVVEVYKPVERKPLPKGGETIGLEPASHLREGSIISGKLRTGKTPGGTKINKVLKPYGYGALKEGLDGDHVIEYQLGGKDALPNLWPLPQSENRGAGPTLASAKFSIDYEKVPMSELKQKAVKKEVGEDGVVHFVIKSVKKVEDR